ncbi:hypothetical protein AK812_SmicGene32524 [Symbiodinium microadriaticum]|uniref:Uncharacterized protein n=1 Tax=Symbiodinium microadriaticum TaxID=2951 RepID=A0A1Q9CTW2_SYMMI|nr:hypothetical protein AK812_SmicGene32524 [Symbiodinium microadriaticum]
MLESHAPSGTDTLFASSGWRTCAGLGLQCALQSASAAYWAAWADALRVLILGARRPVPSAGATSPSASSINWYQRAPAALRGAAKQGWLRRWWGLLNVALQITLAAMLLRGIAGASLAPSAYGVLAKRQPARGARNREARRRRAGVNLRRRCARQPLLRHDPSFRTDRFASDLDPRPLNDESTPGQQAGAWAGEVVVPVCIDLGPAAVSAFCATVQTAREARAAQVDAYGDHNFSCPRTGLLPRREFGSLAKLLAWKVGWSRSNGLRALLRRRSTLTTVAASTSLITGLHTSNWTRGPAGSTDLSLVKPTAVAVGSDTV